MIQLKQVTLQIGIKILLEEASLLIHPRQKVSIIGANGVGKSTLFKLILGEIHEEFGEVLIPNNTSFAHIKQEVPLGDQSAVDYALEGHAEYAVLNQKLLKAEAENNGELLAQIHHEMSEIGAYALPAQASKVLLGLGFSQEQLSHPIKSFSGGWRMRLNLAQVLVSNAEVLLLDEPTNHLDLEAILWLEQWLAASQQTILLISHDREFIDKVTSHIVHFENQNLKSYTGNYSDFERMRAEQLAIQHATFVKQQQAKQHLQSFVDRFRYKASKAKQAQSRLKMLEKMEFVADVHTKSAFRFEFKNCIAAGNPMLSLHNANVGYGEKIVLNKLNLSLSDGERIGLVGPNGAGKSTFVKLLARELTELSGEATWSKKINVGYFAQHQLEQLHAESSAIEHLYRLDKKLLEKDARKYLGGFNFQGDDVFRPVSSFSGGEKSRLVLALLIWQSPNLLLLDEPTNHLDLEVREALALALQNYQGAVIIVSHDRYLLKSVADELWLVADNQVKNFEGDIDDYREWFNQRLKLERQADKNDKNNQQKNSVNKSTQQNIDKQLEQLEKKIDKAQQELDKLDIELADNDLYLPESKKQLEKINFERKKILKIINDLEVKLEKLLS